MHEQDETLFAGQERESDFWRSLAEGRSRLSIAYDGEAIQRGRMDAVALAEGLRASRGSLTALASYISDLRADSAFR